MIRNHSRHGSRFPITLGGGGGYSVAKSLRFRSSASAYLNRTPATAGTGGSKTWTYSGWVKRGVLGTRQSLLDGYDASRGHVLEFQTTDTLDFYGWGAGAAALDLNTTQVFRDPAAWYHIVLAVDTTQATASDRIKMYVNGSQVTSFGTATYPTQNANTYISSNVVQDIGRRGDAQFYADGEQAEVNFVDGQALAPTAFGAYSTYNQWLPIRYAGTYGTNGFYLPFTNTTSTSTLVADSSGNGNNWTPNNISLTAGSTYDSLTDVPTLTSTTVANYAVLNPIGSAGSYSITNGNLNVKSTGASYALAYPSMQMPASKTYVEFNLKAVQSAYSNQLLSVGIANTPTSISTTVSNGSFLLAFNSVDLSSYSYQTPSTGQTSVGSAPAANDIAQIAYDGATGKLWFGVNNTWFVSGNPSAGTNPIYTYATTASLMIFVNIYSTTPEVAMNFGQQPFTYTPPSGFLPLNTFNITAGTVTTSGTFTGNLSTDGPMVYLNGTPTAMTINGNAVTFGTHADKLANGFKVRSSSVLYNLIGSNTYVATTVGAVFKYEDTQSNP